MPTNILYAFLFSPDGIYYYYYLLTAIGLMPGGSVTKIGRTYNKSGK
jgi:hypothetical protein